MKIIDWVTNKIGTDKLLHLSFGGWFTSVFSAINVWCMIAATVVLFGLGFVKEKWLDKTFEWGDIIASMVGSALSFIIYLIIILT